MKKKARHDFHVYIVFLVQNKSSQTSCRVFFVVIKIDCFDKRYSFCWRTTTMPEIAEALSHYHHAFHLFQQYSAAGADFTVLGLYADASEKEALKLRSDSPGRVGQVYEITAESKVKRGSQHSQELLYPPMWRSVPHKTRGRSLDKPDPPKISTLKLVNIQSTARAMLLDFGELCLKVRTRLE